MSKKEEEQKMLETVPDLWSIPIEGEIPLRFDPRPVAGMMAPFVSHQYTAEEIWRFRLASQEIRKEEEQQVQRLSARIRAFDIPSLKHAQVRVSQLADFPEVLHELLQSHLPGWTWETSHCRLGPIKKYGILHTQIPAPAEATTQQPMVIELVGHLSSLNGQSVKRGWFVPFRQTDRAQEEHLFLGELCLQLERATYANTRYPGIGVPFYL